MHIAVLGATSQIAKDWIRSCAAAGRHTLTLYARRPQAVLQWLDQVQLTGRHAVHDYADFEQALQAGSSTGAPTGFDAILNCVGVGNPAQAVAMGAAILDVTLAYDSLALRYLQIRPACRYIFLSSGAAYGGPFQQPVTADSTAQFALNQLQPQDWYGIAKLHAECRHRAMAQLAIADVRVFNYFSHTQDLQARFLITDALRAVRDGSVLQTSADYMVRDYLHPSDFHQAVECLLRAAPANLAVDCYSLQPVDKPSLLAALEQRFGLRFETRPGAAGVQATGSKPHYYSLNHRLADFGYAPQFGALDGVLREAEKMLDRQN